MFVGLFCFCLKKALTRIQLDTVWVFNKILKFIYLFIFISLIERYVAPHGGVLCKRCTSPSDFISAMNDLDFTQCRDEIWTVGLPNRQLGWCTTLFCAPLAQKIGIIVFFPLPIKLPGLKFPSDTSHEVRPFSATFRTHFDDRTRSICRTRWL